jgi:hypothetical protein
VPSAGPRRHCKAHLMWIEVASTRWLRITLVLFGQDGMIAEPRYVRHGMMECVERMWCERSKRCRWACQSVVGMANSKQPWKSPAHSRFTDTHLPQITITAAIVGAVGRLTSQRCRKACRSRYIDITVMCITHTEMTLRQKHVRI